MDKFLKINLFNKILAIIVFASVLFSFFLEFFLNLIPCKLCLYQRYLWLFLLLACIINLKQSSKSRYIEIIDMRLPDRIDILPTGVMMSTSKI